MSGKTPVLVFCPGAWCDPGYFRFTFDILQKAGWTCLAVSLPSVGSELRPKDAPPITHGLQADAQAVRDVIIPQLDAGHDVVAICHSYGGVVTAEAVKGLDAASRGPSATAVIRLIYVAAIVLDVGGKVWPEDPPREEFITDGDLCWRNPKAPNMDVWLANFSEEQMMLLGASIRSHRRQCFYDVTTYVGWRDIPGTYVKATKDLMPDMISAAPEGHRFEEIVEIDAGHFCFTNAPEEVAQIIQRTAEKAAAGTSA